MKKSINTSMIITSILVQAYIALSRTWAIGDKMYKNTRDLAVRKTPSLRPTVARPA